MPPKIRVVGLPYWDPNLPTSERENSGVTDTPRKIFEAFHHQKSAGVDYPSWSGRSMELLWDSLWDMRTGKSQGKIIREATGNSDGVPPLFIGGDHALTKHILREHATILGRSNSGLILFDAHADAKLSSQKGHARWMAECVKEGLVFPERVLLLGSRAVEMGSETKFLLENRIPVMDMRDFTENPREQWKLMIRNNLNNWREPYVHITIDIDVLDPSEAPGTLHRSSGGMRLADHLLPALETISQSGVRVASMDLVEINTDYDPSENGVRPGLTINAAMTIIRELAALFGKE